jgi:hypothetical protein
MQLPLFDLTTGNVGLFRLLESARKLPTLLAEAGLMRQNTPDCFPTVRS